MTITFPCPSRFERIHFLYASTIILLTELVVGADMMTLKQWEAQSQFRKAMYIIAL